MLKYLTSLHPLHQMFKEDEFRSHAVHHYKKLPKTADRNVAANWHRVVNARSCCFVMHSIWQKRGFQAAFQNRFASCTKEGIFLLVSLGFDAAMFLSLSLSSLYISNSYTHRLIKLSCEACHIATFRNEVKLCSQKLKA